MYQNHLFAELFEQRSSKCLQHLSVIQLNVVLLLQITMQPVASFDLKLCANMFH